MLVAVAVAVVVAMMTSSLVSPARSSRLRFAFTLPSLCIHLAFALHSPCLRFAFTLPSLCIHLAFALHSPCLRFVFTLPSLCIHLAFSGYAVSITDPASAAADPRLHLLSLAK